MCESPGRQPCPPAAAETQQPPKPRKKRRPWWKRVLKASLFVLYLLVLAEAGSRVYWAVHNAECHMGLLPNRRDWYNSFYKELHHSGVWDAEIGPDDGHFDVLMLGGSALAYFHASVAVQTTRLQEALQPLVRQPVRVFSLAAPAMTSRDSLIKYRLLAEAGKRFDLVVLYHAVNDTRMNCCPPKVFRDDYTHAMFNKQIERMEAHWPWLRFFTLPYTIEYTTIHILASKSLNLKIFLPRHRPSPDWVAHSDEVKTANAFRGNIEGVLDLARQRGEPVLLMTFGWHIPPDYSAAKLARGELDYAPGPNPSWVELWGTVEGVRKGIIIHNNIVRELARSHPEVIFVDAESAMAGQSALFRDFCHLSEAGTQYLLEAFLPVLAERFAPAATQAAAAP